MKNFADLDKNFESNYKQYPDIEFRSYLEEPFSLHGLHNPHTEGCLTRLPMEFSDSPDLNDVAKLLMYNPAGARIRFRTDSPYIAVYAVLGRDVYVLNHMAALGVYGLDMYVRRDGSRMEPEFTKSFIPNLEEDGKTYRDSYEFRIPGMKEITINLPLYHDLSELYIGLSKDARLEAPNPYYIQKPVVFYGSSITQGGCASRPGTVYTSIISRKLDCDTINLGSSGSALGEPLVANYIAGLPLSALVMEYDYNVPSPEYLEETHHNFYKIVRDANPDIPIIMMSAPLVYPNILDKNNAMQKRRIVVMESYIKGMKDGDKNLYFVDGAEILGDEYMSDSTVDRSHPTDCGFRAMANRLYPMLKALLY